MINFYPVYIDEQTQAIARGYFEEHEATLDALWDRAEGDPSLQRKLMREYYARYPVPQTSLDVLLDHFDHAIALAGPDHVGIGADWDGVPSMPVGMEDISDLPSLTEGLLARGHSRETIRKVLGENLLRVLGAAEDVAREMRAEGLRGRR